MVKKFDINSGEFVDVGSPDGGQIPSNTIHSGIGAPATDVGIEGDFYIDTQSMNFYGPKEAEWGVCVCLLGKDGLPGDSGKDGALGRDGRDGRDGVDGVDGTHGKDGIDGKDGAPGRDGISPPSIELQSTPTHVQFRYGLGEWKNLFEIPKNKTIRGGGGGKTMANIQAAIDAALASIDLSDYIRLDGTSTTTAQIPFAQGISVPDNQYVQLGSLGFLYTDGVNFEFSAAGGDLNLSSAFQNVNLVGTTIVSYGNLEPLGFLQNFGASANPWRNAYIQRLANLATNGFVKTGSGNGTLSVSTAVNLASEVTGDLPFSNIQQITTDRLLGRDTAGTGDIEQLIATGGIEFTGTGIQTSAFTGDVTKTAGGTALTIANDVVTNAKMANMATQTIKGRTTAGTGDPEDLTPAQAHGILIGYDIPTYTIAHGA